MTDAGDSVIAGDASLHAKHVVRFQRTAGIANFNAVVVADNLRELAMSIVPVHKHVNECFTHNLYGKLLCFGLKRITMESIPCGKLSIDDAQKLIDNQEDWRVGVNAVKAVGNGLPIIAENTNVIDTCKGTGAFDSKLLAEQQNSCHIEFLGIVLASTAQSSQ